MAIHGSGSPIYMSELAAEFGGSTPYYLSQFYRGGGRVTANNTGVPTSGTIYLSQFYGATKVTSGSATYSTPGTYTFYVPAYSSLTVYVDGAGGGAGLDVITNGNAGGSSVFYGSATVIGYGGGGGTTGAGGAGGSASGGDTNTAGSAGSMPNGGAAANGTAGQAGYIITYAGQNWGKAGGVGPGGGSIYASGSSGYGGGGGGRAVKTFGVGALSVGGGYTVVVGAGGAGGSGGAGYVAGTGGDGQVYIVWS
jgi:hypothetical protein